MKTYITPKTDCLGILHGGILCGSDPTQDPNEPNETENWAPKRKVF